MFIFNEGSEFVRIKGIKTLEVLPDSVEQLSEMIESIQETLPDEIFFMLDSGDNAAELTILEDGDTIDISALDYSLEKCPTLRTCEPLNRTKNVCQTPKMECVAMVPTKFSLIIDLLYTPQKGKKISFTEAVETINIWLEEYVKAIDYYSTVYSSVCELVSYHFSVNGKIITIFYPLRKRDDELAEIRKGLHELLDLPLDRPYIRRCNAIYQNRKDTKKLVSVHREVPDPLSGGLIEKVFGYYTYFHYLQDGIQDNGWGCAYRSLQTIISWFVLQGYKRIKMPSHREIQQALVAVRDKESKFVGSRQWIGSIEVSNCLRYFCSVESKILSIDKGENMSNIARALLLHFEKQGTPVMIGGGVLAHTILGVWFDEVSGEARYLILDPHYTGGEDVKTVISKGWCGWKDKRFWDEKAHYNLCLPQKPSGI